MKPGTSALPLPSWAMNLLGFGLLIALVLAVFFWQLLDMDRELQRNTQARSATMAAIIEENLANADLATTTIDTLTTTFLRDKARFIEYLHTIDPLQTDELAALARHYGFRIIEDASHAIGATYGETAIGGCAYSDITVFSFHPVKIITTGEGGMALTNAPELARRLSLLRSHGITRAPDEIQGETHGPWYYQQQALGFNYRMTDMQAALGLSQLQRLDHFITRRRQLVDQYDLALAPLPMVHQGRPADRASAHHLYVIRLQDTTRRRAVFDHLRAHNIGVNVHYIPVHLQPDYAHLGFQPGQFPASETYYAGAITLPLHAGLTDAEQAYVLTSLTQALA